MYSITYAVGAVGDGLGWAGLEAIVVVEELTVQTLCALGCCVHTLFTWRRAALAVSGAGGVME
jgi:hypothetical protein